MAQNKKLHGMKRILSSMLAAVIVVSSVTTAAMAETGYEDPATGNDTTTGISWSPDGEIAGTEGEGFRPFAPDLGLGEDVTEESVIIDDELLYPTYTYGVDSDVIDDTDGIFTQAEYGATTSAEWTGTVATSYAGGEGTETSPYLIATGEQLAYLAQQVNAGESYEDTYFKLTADILLNSVIDDYANEWTPIGWYDEEASKSYNFYGTFDGNGHKVIGLYIIDGSTPFMGLFGRNSGTVKNLGVIDGYMMCGGDRIGGVCGINFGTIENCYNSVPITSTTAEEGSFGGVCGVNSNAGKLISCYNKGTLNMTGGTASVNKAAIGGVCGLNSYGTITDCYNEGIVKCTQYSFSVGGVCGQNYPSGTITGSYNKAEINGGYSVGGVCGYGYYAKINKCHNLGTVNGIQYVAGVCGWMERYYITESYNTGAINGSEYTAGICGWNDDAYITDCHNTGAVTGTSRYTAGICAMSANSASHTTTYGRIIECYNTGKISGGTNGYTAGICARVNDGPVLIENCFNKGNVVNSTPTTADKDNNYHTAGICAYMTDTTIKGCYNEGAIASTLNTVGGIGGFLASKVTIENCYNIGAISANAWAGGVWAASSDTTNVMKDSYNAGTVKLTSNAVSLYPVGNTLDDGNSAGSISGVFFDSDVCTDKYSTNTDFAKTTAELTNKLVIDYLGFDDDIWAKKTNTEYCWYYPDLVAFDDDNPVAVVGLPAPTGVKVGAGDTKVQIKWNAVEGASYYRVMVWDGTEWVGYNTTATSYMVRDLTNGKKYAFAVKACAGNVTSAASTTAYATPSASKIPTGVKAGAGDGKVQVKWNAVNDATSYRVMVWNGESWTGYSTTATSYIVRNLTNNKKYAFVVKAYVYGEYGDNSETVYATPVSSVPTDVKAGAGDSKVQVKWTGIAGATSYRVMVWDGAKWTGYNTTATSYMVRNLTNNKTYAFAVKAYINKAYTDTSATVYAVPHSETSIIPTGVKAGGGDSKVQVKWNTVYGASSYRVMVWDGSKWTGYNTTSTSYIVRNLTNGKKYAFVVKAYINGAYSANSTTVYATPNA